MHTHAQAHTHPHHSYSPSSHRATHLLSIWPVRCSLFPAVVHQLRQAGEGGLCVVLQNSRPFSSDHETVDVRHILNFVKGSNASSQFIKEHSKSKDIHLGRRSQESLFQISLKQTAFATPTRLTEWTSTTCVHMCKQHKPAQFLPAATIRSYVTPMTTFSSNAWSSPLFFSASGAM